MLEGIGLEILFIFLLILANGVFAMSEIAVVSSRKSRLKQQAEAGSLRARRALELAEHPNRFLSTVQVGITLIGVFAGAYGGASIAGQIEGELVGIPGIGPYSRQVALGLVVFVITYLSLIIGELVPKRIALTQPERIAGLIAGPMQMVSIVAAPLVKVLSVSTDLILRMLRIRKGSEAPVTEDEITALLQAGTEAGVFEEEEHEIVERLFWLGDQKVATLMTPRHRVEWLDVRDSPEDHRAEFIRHRYAYYLVCDGDLDHVLGMAGSKDLLATVLEGRPLNVTEVLRKPLFIPESLPALRLLEMFRETGIHLAVVIDEYGGVEGLITLHDVLEEITGDLEVEDDRAVQRADGSWLVDGSLPMDEFWELLDLEERRSEERLGYNTLGGLVVTELGRIPKSGDTFEAGGMRLEVVDMDGHRVDKVLVSHIEPPAGEMPDLD